MGFSAEKGLSPVWFLEHRGDWEKSVGGVNSTDAWEVFCGLTNGGDAQ